MQIIEQRPVPGARTLGADPIVGVEARSPWRVLNRHNSGWSLPLSFCFKPRAGIWAPPGAHNTALPRLEPFLLNLRLATKTNDGVEPPGAMKNEPWPPAWACHAASVALATSGPIPRWVRSACQLPGHYCPSLLQASAHFTRVPGSDWQGCAGPEGALWSHSVHCISETNMATPVGSVCLSAARTLARLRES